MLHAKLNLVALPAFVCHLWSMEQWPRVPGSHNRDQWYWYGPMTMTMTPMMIDCDDTNRLHVQAPTHWHT